MKPLPTSTKSCASILTEPMSDARPLLSPSVLEAGTSESVGLDPRWSDTAKVALDPDATLSRHPVRSSNFSKAPWKTHGSNTKTSMQKKWSSRTSQPTVGPFERDSSRDARGRATPSNHYRVNLEVFLEDMNAVGDELEDDF